MIRASVKALRSAALKRPGVSAEEACCTYARGEAVRKRAVTPAATIFNMAISRVAGPPAAPTMAASIWAFLMHINNGGRPATCYSPRIRPCLPPFRKRGMLSPDDGEQGMPKSWHRGTWQRRRVAATDLTAGPAALRAVLVRTPPSGSDWLPEVKLDG